MAEESRRSTKVWLLFDVVYDDEQLGDRTWLVSQPLHPRAMSRPPLPRISNPHLKDGLCSSVLSLPIPMLKLTDTCSKFSRTSACEISSLVLSRNGYIGVLHRLLEERSRP